MQALSDIDPRSVYLGMTMLLACLSSGSEELSSMMSEALFQPGVQCWVWPAWRRSPVATPATRDSPQPAMFPPSLKFTQRKYHDVVTACVRIQRAHHDETEVSDALEDLQSHITLQAAADAACGLVMSPVPNPAGMRLHVCPYSTHGYRVTLYAFYYWCRNY